MAAAAGTQATEGTQMPHAAGAHAAAAALAAASLTAATPAPAPAPRAPAPHTAPARAGGALAAVGGTAAPGARPIAGPAVSGTARLRLYLAGRDPAGLAAYAAAVSTPGNPRYGRYLTPAQAAARFGPTRSQITALRAWLTRAGLATSGLRGSGAAGAYLAAHGSLRAAGRAFGISFGLYRGPDGQLYRGPGRAARLPARLAGSVLSISGLDTASHVATPDLPSPRRNAVSQPCSRYFGEKTATGLPAAYGRHWPWAVCGYFPRHLRSAYGAAMSGAGQTVAIVDAYASPTIRADAARYARTAGVPAFRPGQYQEYRTGRFTLAGASRCGGPAGWHLEQTLDVESAHGVAPGAAIRYVAARSCRQQDLAEALAFIVNRRLASIVSDSWGWPAADFTLQAAVNVIAELGAAEGIGFFFSSGDRGYNSPAQNPASSQIQVQYPASSPWVTSVGGTSLAVGRRGAYQWETSWGALLDPLARDGRKWRYAPPGAYPAYYDGSGGGGVSASYPQPFYQRGVVPPALARSLPDGTRSPVPMRVVPDVSADANPATGLLIGVTAAGRGGRPRFSLQLVGGTSLACPTFAAIQAGAQQRAGHALGFANPAIYARYGTSAYHDVTDHPLGPVLPSVVLRAGRDVFLQTLGLNGEGPAALRAVRGYDDATGVGSPARYQQSY